jgi:hypothetical protein
MMSALEAARARFVVSLREPVARDISWYHQARANNDDIQKSYHSYVTSRLNQIQQCAAPLGGSANVSLDLYVRCTQGSVCVHARASNRRVWSAEAQRRSSTHPVLCPAGSITAGTGGSCAPGSSTLRPRSSWCCRWKASSTGRWRACSASSSRTSEWAASCSQGPASKKSTRTTYTRTPDGRA